MKREIYLDNAATSWPKPPGVLEAMERFQSRCGASAGRGAYPRAEEAGRVIAEARAILARLLGAPAPERLVFTLHCTDSIHLVLHGIEWRPGDAAVVSATEHNAVMRPLHALRERWNVTVERLPATPCGRVELEALEATLKRLGPRARIVCLQHASNVLGGIQPVEEAARICRAAGVPILVDAAQTAGAVPIDVAAAHIDVLAAPGHKALLGPLGTGVLYVRPGLDPLTVREGGTGSRSEEEVQPTDWPDRMEAGSHNAIGIAGLGAAAKWLERRGVAAVGAHKAAMTARLLEGIADVRGLRVLGPGPGAARAGLVSVALEGVQSADLAERLYETAGVCVRPGLHCAPAAHRLAGTYPDGAVRLSVGWRTTEGEIDAAVKALRAAARRRP